MLPHALVMHVNPASFAETFTKKIERIQTRGGFVEQHWGDDLGDINCDGSTGAFMNIYTGLSSIVRQRTIAWDRYRDLYDLYRNNGSLIDPYGNIVLQGRVMVMYDRGTYLGHFKSFSVEETDDSPFAFKVSWSFKVETTIYQIPINDFGPAAKTTPGFGNATTANLGSLPNGFTNAQYSQAAQNAANQTKAAANNTSLQQQVTSYQANQATAAQRSSSSLEGSSQIFQGIDGTGDT